MNMIPAAEPVKIDDGETVPAGDAVRARIHFLVAENHAMIVQTQFADAKAAALLTLCGVAAYRLPAAGGHDAIEMVLTGVLLLAMLFCLLAIIPRYPRTEESVSRPDRFTWTALAANDWSPGRNIAWSQEAPFPELLAAVSASNVGGARVLAQKFRLIRLAFHSAIAAILLIAVRSMIDP